MTQIKPMNDAEFATLVAKHDREGGALARAGQSNTPQGCWDSGIKIIRNCGHMVVPEYLIQFSQLAHEKIECLKRAYPSLEWLAYLEGTVDHDTREVVVEDLIIPESQVVSGGHVGQVEYSWNEGKQICGVIHSHNTMGAFFSGTDDTYINQNHDVSICVSTAVGREICAQVRVKTPCGSYIINNNIKFKVDYATALDEKEFVAEFSPKIRTPRILGSYSRPAPRSGKGVRDVNSVRGGQASTATTRIQPLHTVEDVHGLDEIALRAALAPFYPADEVEELFLEGGSPGLREELEECYAALGLETTPAETTTDETFEFEEPEVVGWETDLLDVELEKLDDDEPDKVNIALN